MKRFRSSIILALVLSILIIFVVYQNKTQKGRILGMDVDSISSINIDNKKTKKQITLLRSQDGWFISGKPVNHTFKIHSILNAIDARDSKKITVTTQDEELIKYGLDMPVIELVVEDGKGASESFYIGDRVPTDQAWYVLVKNINTVITLPYIYDILDVQKESLLDQGSK